jgi:hypothetical protein
MIDCPPWTSVPCHRISRRLEVAGCLVDLSVDEVADGTGASGAACRLAEGLVAARIGCERHLVRVAALMPSGRPVAMVRGRAAAVSVSVSHIGTMIGAAACATVGVGLDIVDPAEAGRSLDPWFTPAEITLLPDDDGLLRVRLWGAKEAAFKAAGLDDGFRPRSVVIEDLRPASFRWRLRCGPGRARGQGVFTVAGMHLVAVAVAAASTTSIHPSRS